MCSPRVCLIVWTTVILGLATALLVNIIMVNTAPGKDFTHWLPLTLLVVICVVVGLNLVVLMGAIGKIHVLLCLSHFFLGIILFSLISSFITWMVYEIIELNGKNASAGDIAKQVALTSAIFAGLLIVPCIQWCTLSATMKQLESDGGAE